MTLHYQDDWLTVYGGDARTVLPTLASDSVDCIVTSPPYWGLRDYGTATWSGGDKACDHSVGGQVQDSKWEGAITTGQRPGVDASRCRKCGATRIDSQLGLEATPEEYVANLVAVFAEVKRVLRDDGTLWLNLGSSYMAGGERTTGRNDTDRKTPGGRGGSFRGGTRTLIGGVAGGSDPNQSRQQQRAPAYGSDGTGPSGSPALGSAYPDLCDGCRAGFLSRHPRSAGSGQPLVPDEPLPSLTGRDSELLDSLSASPAASPLDALASTTPQSEQLLPGSCSHCANCGACLSVLRSSSRDARECARNSWLKYPAFKPKDMVPIPWMVAMALQADGWYLRSDIIWSKPNPMPESVTDRPTKAHEYLFLLSKSPRYYFDQEAVREAAIEGTDLGLLRGRSQDGPSADGTRVAWHAPSIGKRRAEGVDSRNGNPSGRRNLRSVWTIATRPYPGAHFAVFPPELPERCIKAGSSERGVCPECGAPWERVVERVGIPRGVFASSTNRRPADTTNDARTANSGMSNGNASVTTTGWAASCGHPSKPVPAVILDPFAGSGTVGLVANRLSRRAILIDLNPAYIEQQMKRNAQVPVGL